jgi:hypothetical protein
MAYWYSSNGGRIWKVGPCLICHGSGWIEEEGYRAPCKCGGGGAAGEDVTCSCVLPWSGPDPRCFMCLGTGIKGHSGVARDAKSAH